MGDRARRSARVCALFPLVALLSRLHSAMSTALPAAAPPVALITGGSKGIGRAIALAILKRGGNVCIVDIDAKAGESFLAELAPLGYDAKQHALFCLCDVSDEAQFASAFASCVRQFGYLTIVVNNAGIGDRTMITDEAALNSDRMPPDWPRIINLNLTALINGTRLALRHTRGNGQDCVVINVSSLGGLIGQPYSAVYCATKHAVIGWTRSMGHLRKQGLRVNALCPGFTDTDLVSNATKDSPVFRSMISSATRNSGGLLSVDDIAEGALMIIDDKRMAGAVMSVSRELGFAIHTTPMLYPKVPGAEGGQVAEEAKATAMPHRVIKPLRSRL